MYQNQVAGSKVKSGSTLKITIVNNMPEITDTHPEEE